MSPPQRAPRRRFFPLRLTALSAVVALFAALPLAAASAGSVEGPTTSVAGVQSIDGRPPAGGPLTGPLKTPSPQAPGAEGARAGGDSEVMADAERRRARESPRKANGGSGSTATFEGDRRPQAVGRASAEYAEGGLTSLCGAQASVDERITAQTCVLEEEDRTWGRTYYRNDSGRRLLAVLTLLRPDGRTLQVHCELSASEIPGTCETPRERTVHPLEGEQPYLGVAEIASADGERKLLRSGSNPADSAGR